MRLDFTTFGEGVIRLSVPAGQRIEAASRFDVGVSGAEALTAAALCRLGWRCGWHSALPDIPPGRLVAQYFRSHGVDLSSVIWRPEGRVSCYYVEFSHPPRPTMVYYDRKASCFANLTPEDIDWNKLLDTRHLHVSGLTVPLSRGTEEIISSALVRAKEKGVTTSFDVNYRQLLWSPEEARAKLTELLKGVDLLFLSRRDAANVFGCDGDAEEAISRLSEMTGARNIVMSLADDGVIGWDGAAFHREAARDVTIIDRIGAGDAMMAGILHGWFRGSLHQGLRYGTVMAALALSQDGNAVITDEAELERLLSADPIDIVR